jgi:hypothetical protein
MPEDLKSGLYVCPVCDEVFELIGELPICESCLSLLERYPPEPPEAKANASAARRPR